LVAPDLLQQRLAREHLPGLAGQGHEEVELQGGQGHVLPRPGDAVPGHVDDEVADAQHLGGEGVGAAQAGTDPGDERLGG
ncbi:hypothetical protein AAY51_24025, partial [Vibrio parahaemolyticus]